MTVAIQFDYESQVKLSNKAEHMKVKVTQEDTLHIKMFFYHTYYIVIALWLYYHAGLMIYNR